MNAASLRHKAALALVLAAGALAAVTPSAAMITTWQPWPLHWLIAATWTVFNSM